MVNWAAGDDFRDGAVGIFTMFLGFWAIFFWPRRRKGLSLNQGLIFTFTACIFAYILLLWYKWTLWTFRQIVREYIEDYIWICEPFPHLFCFCVILFDFESPKGSSAHLLKNSCGTNWLGHNPELPCHATYNWVAPPDVDYYEVLVPTEFNIFDQTNEVKRVWTPPIAIHVALKFSLIAKGNLKSTSREVCSQF